MSGFDFFPVEIAGYCIPQLETEEAWRRSDHSDIPSLNDEHLLAELWGAQNAYAASFGLDRIYVRRTDIPVMSYQTVAEWCLERVRRIESERADRRNRSRR